MNCNVKEKSAMGIYRSDWFATAAIVIALATPVPAQAQFNSGSSGTHGVFPPIPEGGSIPNVRYIVWNMRTGVVRYCSVYNSATVSDQCSGAPAGVAQIPNIPIGGLTSGIYEFTDFTVPSLAHVGNHREVYLVGGSANVPLTILSQGDITLPGSPQGYVTNMYLNGQSGSNTSSNFSLAGARGGPGGFDGAASGNGGATPSDGSSGFGPAGGAGGRVTATTIEGLHGAAAGATPLNPSLTPLAGGSGGGGGAGAAPNTLCGTANLGYAGGPGGGGGGAVLLAASHRVTIGPASGVFAEGGNGGRHNSTSCGFGGGGAGGSIRIVAQEFNGNGSINVGGGTRANGSVPAPGGQVRIETALNTFTGSINGSIGGSFISFPTAAVPANQPILQLTSIGGTAVPASPTALLASPDVTFADAITAPVSVAVQASNVPTGTPVNIRVVPATGQPTTATTSALTGSLSISTAVADVTLPPGAGIVTASATFSTTGGQGVAWLRTLPLIDGKRPERVEVATLADGSSRTYVLAESGARFEIGIASK